MQECGDEDKIKDDKEKDDDDGDDDLLICKEDSDTFLIPSQITFQIMEFSRFKVLILDFITYLKKKKKTNMFCFLYVWLKYDA